MEHTVCIQALDICHSFGEKQVLQQIHMEVEAGEIFGLLGPSGAGKTTLIKILTGQLKAQSGKATILQKASESLTGEDYKQIGIMMDSFGLYDRMNCYDNLKFFTLLHHISKDKIEAVLEKVGLKAASKTVVENLSKGMRSRLLLARAILTEPKVLFLDEPTSGLDPATANEIHELILEQQAKGVTIFLTTHNMTEAEKLCQHVALLNEGHIVEYGNPQEVCRQYNHQRKLLIHLRDGSDVTLVPDTSCLPSLNAFIENGELETIHSTEPNLETVFMELTGRGLDSL